MKLTNLADVCRTSGLKVVEVAGWENRGRPASTGGFAPRGVLCHHTGDKANGATYANWLAKVGRSDLPAPLCHLSVDRQGVVYVIAAGRANHAGKAKVSGPMPAGDGNELYIGIEAQNTGSEGWTSVQHDAYVRLCAALCSHYDWPATHVRAHRETSVTGKWDPGAIDMDAFRGLVDTHITNPAKPIAPEDDMPLNDADKKWITQAIATANKNTDVLNRNRYSDLRAQLVKILEELDAGKA